MNKKVLVTGSTGQLGKTIEELYADNNLGLDFEFVSKTELDITKEGEIALFFKVNQFDYCINCAAYTNVEQAEKTPEMAFKVNSEGVKNLAITCKDTNTILIHISTDYVFDGEKEEPYTTDDIPNPINEYGKSKLLGEKNIQEVMDNFFIVRTSWLFSKKHGHNFYKTIAAKAKTEKELSVTTDQVGCPTDTVNLSKFIIELVMDYKKRYGVYHYCDEQPMTWFDFAGIILKENSIPKDINLTKSNGNITFAKRPKYSVLLTTKI